MSEAQFKKQSENVETGKLSTCKFNMKLDQRIEAGCSVRVTYIHCRNITCRLYMPYAMVTTNCLVHVSEINWLYGTTDNETYFTVRSI